MQLFLLQTVLVGCLLFAADFSWVNAAEPADQKKDSGPAAAVQDKKPPMDLTAQLKKKLASIDLPLGRTSSGEQDRR